MISQNSEEKTCNGVLVSVRLLVVSLKLYLQKDSIAVVSSGLHKSFHRATFSKYTSRCFLSSNFWSLGSLNSPRAWFQAFLSFYTFGFVLWLSKMSFTYFLKAMFKFSLKKIPPESRFAVELFLKWLCRNFN